jgi:hypothetical protein
MKEYLLALYLKFMNWANTPLDKPIDLPGMQRDLMIGAAILTILVFAFTVIMLFGMSAATDTTNRRGKQLAACYHSYVNSGLPFNLLPCVTCGACQPGLNKFQEWHMAQNIGTQRGHGIPQPIQSHHKRSLLCLKNCSTSSPF